MSYTDIGEGYQYHLPTEEDQTWVEECLADNSYWTADIIYNASTPDETSDNFKISRIFSYSETNQKLGIILHQVIKPMSSLVNYGIVVHPSLRNKGVGHEFTKQLLRWDRDINKWSVNNYYFLFENSWDTTFLGDNWTTVTNPPLICCSIKLSEVTL